MTPNSEQADRSGLLAHSATPKAQEHEVITEVSLRNAVVYITSTVVASSRVQGVSDALSE